MPSPVMYFNIPDMRYMAWGYHGPGWYHWDETWSRATGPFPTRAEAEAALAVYAKSLER